MQACPTPVGVSGITNATAIAAGIYHSCALLSTGGIKCWGSNNSGQLGDPEVGGITNAIAIAAGGEDSCALLSTGQIECWGNNGQGELGDGTNMSRSTPVAVSGIANAIAVAVGSGHSCALLATGQIDCWGMNYSGQLGNGTNTESSTPVAVSGIANATAIAAGVAGAQSCAVLATGNVKCWGANTAGQLGNGTTTDSWRLSLSAESPARAPSPLAVSSRAHCCQPARWNAGASTTLANWATGVSWGTDRPPARRCVSIGGSRVP